MAAPSANTMALSFLLLASVTALGCAAGRKHIMLPPKILRPQRFSLQKAILTPSCIKKKSAFAPQTGMLDTRCSTSRRCEARIRYRAPLAPAMVFFDEDRSDC